MSKKCKVYVKVGSLVGQVNEADWFFSIRRIDGASHPLFQHLDNQELNANELKQFLPNWNQLNWIPIKDGLFGKSESYAKDEKFKINLESLDSGNKSHKEIIQDFNLFMKKSTSSS